MHVKFYPDLYHVLLREQILQSFFPNSSNNPPLPTAPPIEIKQDKRKTRSINNAIDKYMKNCESRELSFYLDEHTGEQRLDTSFIDSNLSINDIITILNNTLPEEDSQVYGALMRHESWDKRKTPITQNQINYLSQIFRQVNFRESVFSYAKEKEFDRISDKNVFLCGRTGTGKTTTLLSIYGGMLLRYIYNFYTVKPLFLKWEHITNSNFWKFFRRERYHVIFIDDFMNSEFTDTFDSKIWSIQLYELFLIRVRT